MNAACREIQHKCEIKPPEIDTFRSNECRRSSVTDMLKNLKWEPLNDRRRNARLVLLLQIISGEVDIPVDPEYLEEGRRGRYKHLDYKQQQYQHSYYPETIRDWNTLSADVKASKSVVAFKSNLPKNYY